MELASGGVMGRKINYLTFRRFLEIILEEVCDVPNTNGGVGSDINGDNKKECINF